MATVNEIINRWANYAREAPISGQASSVRFSGTKLYSYECQIAQIYPLANLCLVRDPKISVTTSKHCAMAYRSAGRHYINAYRLHPDVASGEQGFSASALEILLDQYRRTRLSRNDFRAVKGAKHAALFEELTEQLRSLEQTLYQLGAVLPGDAETLPPPPEPKRLRVIFVGE